MGKDTSAPARPKCGDRDKSTGCRPALRRTLLSRSASPTVCTVRTVANVELLINSDPSLPPLCPPFGPERQLPKQPHSRLNLFTIPLPGPSQPLAGIVTTCRIRSPESPTGPSFPMPLPRRATDRRPGRPDSQPSRPATAAAGTKPAPLALAERFYAPQNISAFAHRAPGHPVDGARRPVLLLPRGIVLSRHRWTLRLQRPAAHGFPHVGAARRQGHGLEIPGPGGPLETELVHSVFERTPRPPWSSMRMKVRSPTRRF